MESIVNRRVSIIGDNDPTDSVILESVVSVCVMTSDTEDNNREVSTGVLTSTPLIETTELHTSSKPDHQNGDGSQKSPPSVGSSDVLLKVDEEEENLQRALAASLQDPIKHQASPNSNEIDMTSYEFAKMIWATMEFPSSITTSDLSLFVVPQPQAGGNLTNSQLPPPHLPKFIPSNDARARSRNLLNYTGVKLLDDISNTNSEEQKEDFTDEFVRYYQDVTTDRIILYKSCLESKNFVPVSHSMHKNLIRLCFGHHPAVEISELKRWFRHPLAFHLDRRRYPWALMQFQGGPCGVLAAIQSVLLQRLQYGDVCGSRDLGRYIERAGIDIRCLSLPDRDGEESKKGDGETSKHLSWLDVVTAWLFPSEDAVMEALVEALTFMLVQAAGERKEYTLCWLNVWEPIQPTECQLHDMDLPTSGLLRYNDQTKEKRGGGTSYSDVNVKLELQSLQIRSRTFTDIPSLQNFIYTYCAVLFMAPRIPGVFNFVLSVLGTRTPERVLKDLDDESSALIGVYGHCSQELVNLLLTGAAVSNVFDGKRSLVSETSAVLGTSMSTLQQNQDIDVDQPNEDDKLTLKGITKRGLVGYLTSMEVHRYCEVGDFLKNPFFPIWETGISNHFTCYFHPGWSFLQVELRDVLETLSQKIFYSICLDNSSGFIFVDQIKDLLALAQIRDPRAIASFNELHSPNTGDVVVANDFVEWMKQHWESSEYLTRRLKQKPESLRFQKSKKKSSVNEIIGMHYDGMCSLIRVGHNREYLQATLPSLSVFKIVLMEPFAYNERARLEENEIVGLSSVIGTRFERRPIKLIKCSKKSIEKALDELLKYKKHNSPIFT